MLLVLVLVIGQLDYVLVLVLVLIFVAAATTTTLLSGSQSGGARGSRGSGSLGGGCGCGLGRGCSRRGGVVCRRRREGAHRARAERPLEGVFKPRDFFRAKTRETRELRRVRVHDLGKTLSATKLSYFIYIYIYVCVWGGGGEVKETHPKGSAEGLDVRLVHTRDARERGAEERGGRLVDPFADERRCAVLGLFVGGEVLPCFVCAARGSGVRVNVNKSWCRFFRLKEEKRGVGGLTTKLR